MSMNHNTTCYECDRVVPAGELSPRSRCVKCEYRRAKFNERENDKLRAQSEEAVARVGKLVGHIGSIARAPYDASPTVKCKGVMLLEAMSYIETISKDIDRE